MKIASIICGASFFTALGLVGTIDCGGSLWLIIPAAICMGIFGLCVMYIERVA